MKCSCLLVVLTLAVGPAVLADAKKSEPNELNRKVLAFAKANLGKKVARGECSDLATAALTEAGAKTDYANTEQGEYVWGTLVESYNAVQPGDIVQLDNAKAKIRLGNQYVATTVRHHTCVILANLGRGRFKTLEQNINGVKKVREMERDFSGAQKGTVRIYRPEAK